MVHNGIEYGLMAAYAEGINILKHADIGKHPQEIDAETTPLRNPELYQYDLNLADIAEVWRRGSVISSWLLDLTAQALLRSPELDRFLGTGLRLGRGPLDDPGGDRRGRAGGRIEYGPVRAIRLARHRRLRRPNPLGHAVRLRRPPGKEGLKSRSELPMSTSNNHDQSDALVFFGATGDLAYKKVFPAIQYLIQHGNLDVPIVGVAKSGWKLEQLRDRARDSLEKHGGIDEAAFAKLVERLRYIDGDYSDPQTFQQLREALGPARRPLHYLAIPPSVFGIVVKNLEGSGCAEGRPGRRREAVRPRPAVRRGAEPDPPRTRSTSRRSSGSITTSARNPC